MFTGSITYDHIRSSNTLQILSQLAALRTYISLGLHTLIPYPSQKYYNRCDLGTIFQISLWEIKYPSINNRAFFFTVTACHWYHSFLIDWDFLCIGSAG